MANFFTFRINTDQPYKEDKWRNVRNLREALHTDRDSCVSAEKLYDKSIIHN
jgi:hypothetical protein